MNKSAKKNSNNAYEMVDSISHYKYIKGMHECCINHIVMNKTDVEVFACSPTVNRNFMYRLLSAIQLSVGTIVSLNFIPPKKEHVIKLTSSVETWALA